jgi:pyrroloquinoline quinone (PQQ) biosynthesis protein C
MGTAFHDQLVATRDKKHSKNHPFFDLWAKGKLTKGQTAIYCAQHYHYVTDYLNWMAYEASQIPFRDVKTYLFENLGDEENPDDRHLDMLKDYVAATGSSRDSVEKSVVLAGTESLQNWGWRLVYQTPWQAALAGMFIGLESQFLDICKKLVPALHEHYGFAQGGREIRFFEEHIRADEIHGAKPVEAATIRRWRYMNGVYWFALDGKDDDTPS